MKKRLSVLVLALAMVLTMSVSVFAADPVPSGSGDTAKLVKYFKMADEVTFPDDAVFKFVFTPADSTASATNPANSYANVPKGDFSGFTYTMSTTDLKAGDVDGGYKLAVPIKDVFPANEFKVGEGENAKIRAGVYSFTVKEDKAGTQATVNDGTLTYSSDEFTLRIGVKNDGSIADVTVIKDGEKVNPQDDDPTQDADQGEEGPEGFTFTNSYFKLVTNHEEPTNPNPEPDAPNPEVTTTKTNAFSLKKFTNGQYADKTKAFNFTVTVKLPDEAKTYDYAAAANVVGTKALADKGEFGYKALPVGTTITVAETEANQGGYTTVATTSAADHAALTFKVTENGAYAIYQNNFDDTSVTPTGIIINNLPYVLLIGIALGGIVLFSRKRRYE